MYYFARNCKFQKSDFQHLWQVLMTHFRMKIFFAFMVFLLASSFPATAQEDPDVGWFESLYDTHKKLSVDDELNQLTDQYRAAVEQGDKQEEIKALIASGVFQQTRVSDYEQAMEWLIKSLTLEDLLNLHHEKIFTLIAMARLFEVVGDYHKCDDFLNQAMEINQSHTNLHVHALILDEKGRVNDLMGNTGEAFRDYEHMLTYARQLQLPGREADALSHLGQLQSKKKEYTEALSTHKKSLAIRRLLRDKVKESVSLNDIGKLYHLMKNHERAMANHEAALKIRQAINDKAGVAESHNNIGILYFEKRDFKKAIVQLNLALKAGHEAQKQEQIRISYDYLSMCYKELNDFKTAFEYKESLLAIEKFIENEKNERQLLETQNRYTLSRKENAINQLKSDREQDGKVIQSQLELRNFLMLLIALGLIIGLLVLYLYLVKRRSNHILQSVNNTKDKLFSIIGHDLRGPLHSLSSFVSLLHNHTDYISKDEIKMLSKDIDKSLKNLFNLLENLLDWSRSQTGNIDFKSEAFDLAEVLKENETLLQGQMQHKGLTLRNETKGRIWVNAHRNSINTVVRNLISNAIKYTPSGGTITVAADPQKDEWRISIADTGVGMSETVLQKLFSTGTRHSTPGTAHEKGTGLGLVLCKDFVEKNGGRIGAESKDGIGSSFYFTVPAMLT